MTYLLAKYALVFLLALISGFLFGRWMTRKSFVDVSDSYEDLRAAATRSDSTQWNTLWSRLDSMPAPKATDLSSVTTRLDGLDYAIGNLPTPAPVNFATVEGRLDDLNKVVSAIPAPVAPKDVDLGPISSKLDSLAAKIAALPAAPKEVDLRPLSSKVDSLADKIAALPVPKEAVPVDLIPVSSKLDKLSNAIQSLPKPEPQKSVDLMPIREQVGSLEQQIRAIPRPQDVNLLPIDKRLSAIEVELGRLGRRLHPVPQPKTPAVAAASAGPVTLKSASHGNKDELRRIFGIGPMLEGLLNKHGVYYFWQVANWRNSDIEVMDERLDTFKGRIVRDEWVKQAKKLSREAGSAQQPTEMRISA